MLHENCNAKNVKNDPKSDFSNLTSCSSNSQADLSVYEIDILSYGKERKEASSKGRSSDGIALKNGKKWKFQIKDSEIVLQKESQHEVSHGIEIPISPLIKSHYPILEASRIEPDSNEVLFEKTDLKKISAAKETHNNVFPFKEKLDDKRLPFLDSKKSKERLKLRVGKLKESCTEENDGKIKPKKNKKKIETDSIHFHHHEHHHYHLGPSNSQNNKFYMKTERSSSPKTKSDELEQKKQVGQESSKSSAINTSSTTTYVCKQSPSLTHPKTDLDCFGTRKENSYVYLPLYSNSIDSFLGTSSDLVMAHTFSQTDLSKSSAVGEVYRKISIEPNAKDSHRMTQKKLSKTEYNELLKSLKVLDNYTNSKTTAKANVKVSHLKCEGSEKKEDEIKKIRNHSSEVVLGSPAVEKTCAREPSNQCATETTSDKNRYASYFSAKRRNESAGLKTISHLDLTKYLKQELKDIKNRLRVLEKLYCSKRLNIEYVDLRGNELEPEMTPGQEIHIFSTKTYIVKSDEKCSKKSTICST